MAGQFTRRALLTLAAMLLIASPVFAYHYNQYDANVRGTAGAPVTITTGSAVKIAAGDNDRKVLVVRPTVDVSCQYGTIGDVANAVPPTTGANGAGWLIKANEIHVFDDAPSVRVDCISVSASGVVQTIEAH